MPVNILLEIFQQFLRELFDLYKNDESSQSQADDGNTAVREPKANTSTENKVLTKNIPPVSTLNEFQPASTTEAEKNRSRKRRKTGRTGATKFGPIRYSLMTPFWLYSALAFLYGTTNGVTVTWCAGRMPSPRDINVRPRDNLLLCLVTSWLLHENSSHYQLRSKRAQHRIYISTDSIQPQDFVGNAVVKNPLYSISSRLWMKMVQEFLF